MNIDRRRLLKLAVLSFGLGLVPKISFGIGPTEQNSVKSNPEEETIKEFAGLYISKFLPTKKDPKTVEILYPGSNSDVQQLSLGIHILRGSPVNKVRYVYTEIGELNREHPVNWHGGLDDLISQLNENLGGFLNRGFLVDSQVTVYPEHHWLVQNIRPSQVREYRFKVPTAKETKELSLVLGYNAFEERAELNEAEKRYFDSDFMKQVRSNYWPVKPQTGVIYPKFARDDQFNTADIILSHQSGDYDLLMFDYLRALLDPRTERKQRVVLTEHPDKNYALIKPVPQYRVEVKTLNHNHYGYVQGEGKVGAVIFTPR